MGKTICGLKQKKLRLICKVPLQALQRMLTLFFTEICLLILLTVCYTILVMFDLRMWYWITDNPSLIFSLFSSIVCVKLL